MTPIALRTTLLVTLGVPLGASLAACGNNHATPDAAVDASAAPPRAIVVAGDFTPGDPGVLSMFDPATRGVRMNLGPAMAVGDDPVLRHIGSELFIINRSDGNNVTILDDQTLQFKEQLGTGASSNPQDVAVVGNKLYVPTYGNAGVTVLTRGSAATTTIDLSADDPDGKPNCISSYLVGSDVYVVCELLDDSTFNPRGPGKVYVVDTATDRVRATVTLGHVNPFGMFEQIPARAPHGGDLIIPTIFFADGTGCVERVTPGAAPTASGCLVSNADLGGYVSRATFQVDDTSAVMFVSVPTVFPHAILRAFDMPSNALWSGPLSASAQTIGDVAACPAGQVVVADTTMDTNGLRLYVGAVEQTTAALPIGLPPKSTHGLVCY